MNLSATVTPDLATGVVVVELHGLLDLQSASTVRAALLKAFARCPDGVIVDLAGLQVRHRSQLTIFAAASGSHAGAGVALVLCAPSSDVARMMPGRVLGGVPVFPDRTAALTAIKATEVTTGQRLTLRLAAAPSAPGQARRAVSAACREWGLAALDGPAVLIVSELISNAVQHAGTDMVLRLTRREGHLHVSVQDFAPTGRPTPRGPDHAGSAPAERGRGLHLVQTYSAAWGIIAAADGKAVWATLRVPRAD